MIVLEFACTNGRSAAKAICEKYGSEPVKVLEHKGYLPKLLAPTAPEPRPQRRHGRVRRPPVPQRRVARVLGQMVSMGRPREALVRQDNGFRP